VIPGETLRDFDMGGHLYVVLTPELADGTIVVANLTTHGRSPACGDGCTIVKPNEHSWVERDSCVYFRGTIFTAAAPLERAKERGELRQSDPCSPTLLKRIQDGALASRFVASALKDAIAWAQQQ
jgi:hypothetical protein